MLQLHSRIEKLLDEGLGSQILRNPRAGQIDQDSLLFGHRRKYVLHRWSVMPNHVHVLLTPLPAITLAEILKDVKGFTSHAIGTALGAKGQIWEEDYYDRFIRDDKHFERVAAYIEWNPAKAKLCADPSLWPFSSANPDAYDRLLSRDRELADGLDEKQAPADSLRAPIICPRTGTSGERWRTGRPRSQLQ
jgi:hypothetical protein